MLRSAGRVRAAPQGVRRGEERAADGPGDGDRARRYLATPLPVLERVRTAIGAAARGVVVVDDGEAAHHELAAAPGVA